VGADVSPLALALARENATTAHLVRADMNRNLPFADDTFDVVTIFNVLYHRWITAETTTLADVARVLRPGGLMLVTEPAFRLLARDMDRVGMAGRRYRRVGFAKLCHAAGFEVLFTSYFTSFGVPILLLMKVLRWFRGAGGDSADSEPAGDMRSLHPIVNNILYTVAAIEAHVIARGVAMPIGVTLVCVARRRS
jgi:SAM-dependent methyltransferase